MELSLPQLGQIISLSAQFSAIIALVKCGRLKPYLNKSEACRKFGRQQVNNWITSGELQVTKDGDHSASWRIDRLIIEALAFKMAIIIILERPEN